MIDANIWRARFPGLQTPWARFDNPAGTQVVDTAINAMRQFLESGNWANSSGYFAASRECDSLLQSARIKLARLLGGGEDEIVIGPSTTANIFMLTRALSHDWCEGDEIVCTELDMDSNVSPWLHAARQRGVRVRTAAVDTATGTLDAARVEELINERTKWVAVTAASNAIGAAPDVERIIRCAKAHSARVLVDAVAYVPHRRVDVGSLGCDVLVTSPYKWYGPHSGVMWVTRDLLETLRAVQLRAAHGLSRLEYGTAQFEIVAGIAAAVDFMEEVGYERIRAIEDGLTSRLLDGLATIDGARVHGPVDGMQSRTSTVGFTVSGYQSSSVAEYLAECKVAVWSGDFHAIELVKAMNLESVGGFVRAGISVYNTVEEVDQLIQAIDDWTRHRAV